MGQLQSKGRFSRMNFLYDILLFCFEVLYVSNRTSIENRTQYIGTMYNCAVGLFALQS